MAQATDLSTEFAVIGRLASEILGRDVHRGAAAISPGQLQLEEVPTLEPQRTEALLEKLRIVFDRLLTSLAHPAKRLSFLIKGSALNVLMNIIRDDPFAQSFDSSVILKARPVIQKRAFECLLVVNELSPSALPPRSSELLFASLRILQTKSDVRLEDCMQEYSALAVRIYQFTTTCLGSLLMVDLFNASLLRDISHCIVNDVSQSADVLLTHSALTCLTSLLQNRANDLKTETKDRIFSSLIITLRTTALFHSDHFLTDRDDSVTRKLYSTLSTFVLSTAIHAGVLNVCSTVFQSGILIRDAEVKAICRNGLQVIDTILRPRVPREVFEIPCNYVIEPATGQVTGSQQSVVKRTHAETNVAPVDQSVPASSTQKPSPVLGQEISANSLPASSVQKSEPIAIDQDVRPQKSPSNKSAVPNSGFQEDGSFTKKLRKEFPESNIVSEKFSAGAVEESVLVEDGPEINSSMNEPSVPETNADAMELISFFKDVESDNHSV